MDGQKPNSDPAAHNKSASTETVFLPRSEFWRAPVTLHMFALLSFNGNEILRLANCPDNVVSAVRHALPQGDIRHFQEDLDLAVCEFLLAGKPFSGRSVKYAVYHCLSCSWVNSATLQLFGHAIMSSSHFYTGTGNMSIS